MHVYWKSGWRSRKWDRNETRPWDLGRALTIGHTRGQMVSLAVSTSVEITGSLSHRLRWLALQHVDDVHAVDALQSCVQTLHCSEKKESQACMEERRRGVGF